MGLLDEAIREHLELKRRRGADAGEVSREESEALGPVRRAPDGTPDLSSIPAPAQPEPPAPEPAHTADPPGVDAEPDWGDETVAHTPPPIPAQPPPYQPPPSGYVMPPAAPAPPEPSFDDSEPLPPLDGDEPPLPEPPREKTRRLPGAGRLRLRRNRAEEPAPPPAAEVNEDEHDPPTAAHHAQPPAPDPYAAPPTNEPAGEDLLEETPEFLEETPDHDRLWFEQRPPRDFDFDK
jgi:hypothetical protein